MRKIIGRSILATACGYSGISYAQEDTPWILEEITVTAQKRSENLQDVSIAITAYSGAQIDRFNLKDSSDLARNVPGLNMGQPAGPGNNPSIFLRGIGLNDYSPNNAGPVAVYVDDLYISSPGAQVFQIFDLERVEILRGPQGTLYGRNTTGGAIKFITAKPTEEFSGSIRAQYGRFNTTKFEGFLSGPIIDGLRARIAFVKDDSDGGIFNVAQNKNANGIDAIAYRGTIEADLDDSLTGSLMVYGGNNKTDVGIYRMFPAVTASGAEDYTGTLGCPVNCTDFFGNISPADFWSGSSDADKQLDIKTLGVQGKFMWQGNNLTITAISGFQDLDRLTGEDTDSSPVNFVHIENNVKSETFTQEVQLAGATDKLDWIIGGYYLDETINQDAPLDIGRDFRDLVETIDPGTGGFDPDGITIGIPTLFYRATNEQKSETVAVFANVDYDFSDKWGVTGGLRYTNDKKSWDGFIGLEEFGTIIPLNDPANPNVTADARYVDNISNSRLSWKAGLDFRPTDGTLLYGSISSGFKSGGFNGGFILSSDEQRPYAPETITAFEVGLKTDLGLNTRLNLAAFYNDYSDIQVFTIFQPPGSPVPVSVLDNAANAKVKGFEFELITRPVQGLDLMLSGAFLDAQFPSDDINYANNRFTQAPKLSLNGMGRYEFIVDSEIMAAVQLDVSYQSKTFFTTDNNPAMSQDGYWLVNAYLSVFASDNGWELGAYAKNLLAKKYFIHGFPLEGFGVNQLMFGERATYGIELKFSFGD
ncbi:MAG: TonB-dependent receptor [Emcibacter sp.]|nr:TonB-dependent receptor [Emcibacter sp.]